jgi:hypothetical protein
VDMQPNDERYTNLGIEHTRHVTETLLHNRHCVTHDTKTHEFIPFTEAPSGHGNLELRFDL